MNQQSASNYRFDRPIIIVAAPRSGSTLLFETMSRAGSLWSIGDESHAVIERFRKFNPVFGICRTNRLLGEDADAETVTRIRQSFMKDLRNADGIMYRDLPADSAGKPRFLEKTPKNALRIPFLRQVFPDARFIYLFRDPRENLSSLIEGWRSSRFVMYEGLPGWPGKWSFLLPPGFEQLRGKSLEEVVAFQWQAVNQFILDDLGSLPAECWTALSYAELLEDTPATIERLCRFAEVPFDDGLRAYCGQELHHSRYTMTPPKAGKWRRNEAMIERVMEGLQPIIARIETAVAPVTDSAVLLTGPVSDRPEEAGHASGQAPRKRMSRNEPCHCGSGLRFKACHGKLGGAETGSTGTQI
jgi:hypothetical protein